MIQTNKTDATCKIIIDGIESPTDASIPPPLRARGGMIVL